ncbi:MAG: hypothetical protein HYX63_01385 [Gammaproteobacteria bacterium]|nr:hypothetical protein [Gammaproteobacteria bacterium]
MKFTKKPIVVEAFQMTRERRENNKEWPAWLHKAWDTIGIGSLFIDPSDPEHMGLYLYSADGIFKIAWDDWIVQGMSGELYPCKPDIFEATYIEIQESSQ